MSAATLHEWNARANEDGSDAVCETCDGLRADLAKATALLKTISRMEAKPAKRESIDDDAATLEAVGHAVFVATIRTRIELFLKTSDKHQRGRP